ncbi:superinfection immunity protein [Sanguibacter massiliensis]|uniref:superinfection immunity protein n=1 Tax=Sanguibacter massiliensis TaxID=1973217 RepID=UPI001A92A9FA|nr:superinfection immunity protein [Sanguibacter massiliensis]
MTNPYPDSSPTDWQTTPLPTGGSAGGTVEPWQQQAPAYGAPPAAQPAYAQPAYAQPTYAQPVAAAGPFGSNGILTDQVNHGGGLVAFAWIVAVLTFFYMLPWAIAVTRGKANHGTVGLINLFLGWSVVAWVISLIMACGAHQYIGAFGGTQINVVSVAAPVAAPVGPSVPAGWYPSPTGVGQQYWDGHAWTGHTQA